MTPVETALSRRDFVVGAAAAAAAASALAAPMSARGAAEKPGTPPDGPLHYLELSEAAALIRSGRLSPVDLALATLERIEAVESRVIAFVNPYPADEVLAQARAAERLLRQGRYLGPLHGIPVGVKDIYLTKGWSPRPTPSSTPASCPTSTLPRWSS